MQEALALASVKFQCGKECFDVKVCVCVCVGVGGRAGARGSFTLHQDRAGGPRRQGCGVCGVEEEQK